MARRVVRVVLSKVDLWAVLGGRQTRADDQLVRLNERIASFQQLREVPGVAGQRGLAAARNRPADPRRFVGLLPMHIPQAMATAAGFEFQVIGFAFDCAVVCMISVSVNGASFEAPPSLWKVGYAIFMEDFHAIKRRAFAGREKVYLQFRCGSQIAD